MPSNSQFTINNFSPDFRDALLNRNLLADTVANGSLGVWLDGINKIPDIGDGYGMVKGSPDIEVSGPIFRLSNSKFNKNKYIDKDYKGANIPFTSQDIIFPNSSYGQYSTAPISSPTNDGEFFRDSNTIFNIFKKGGVAYFDNSIIDYNNINVVTNTDYINIFGGKSNPNIAANFRRDLSITQNRYKSSTYQQVSLNLLPLSLTLNLNANTYAPTLDTYTTTMPSPGPFQGVNLREFNTTKNMYLDVAKQTKTVIDTDTLASAQQFSSYLDEKGNLNYGDTGSVQLNNALESISDFSSSIPGLIPDFDVRNSIIGRGLTSGGVLSDTRLGQISPKFLSNAIRSNIAFNLREETLGRVNTNILSLAMGGSLIAPNDKITVASTRLGRGIGFLEKITGAKIPVSLLQDDADIFSHTIKGYNTIGNIERANAILKNTGTGTVGYLFGNIKSNINPNFLGNRQGYAPAFKARRDEISNAKLYALYNGKDGGDGTIKDILSQTEENSPIPQSSYNLGGMVNNSGFEDGVKNVTNFIFIRKGKSSESNIDTGFTWSDEKHNKLARDISPTFNGDEFGRNEEGKKSILYKTQELFNSGNMRTLVSGKGMPASDNDETTTTTRNFISKGSAVLKNGSGGTGKTADEMFARAWSPVDRYDEYADLQKHSALSKKGRIYDALNISDSVLRENGIVQIGPYKGETIKRFMFSLENLAWDGQTTKLRDCEIGPGDSLTGTKGRIMWFPPYDISINESVSASYDRTNFIGRGEPIYTYNNTERTGTLSWKIVVDHPNYLNFFKDGSNEDYASFFAGALDVKDIRDRILTKEQSDRYEIDSATEREEIVPKKGVEPFEFSVYFPNDVSNVPSTLSGEGYESGLNKSGTPIDYKEYPSGKGYGMKTTQRSHGRSRVKDNDNTNFGLNGPKTPINLSMLDIEELDGWYGLSSSFEPETKKAGLATFFIPSETLKYFTEGNCKYCKIELTGYASPHGSVSYNENLSKTRGDNIKAYLVEELGIDKGRIEVNKSVAIKESESDCKKNGAKDSEACKKDRKVLVTIKYDATLESNENPKPTERDPAEPVPKFVIPLSNFYTECNYFQEIKKTDSFVYKQFKDKIKNFHPAFHAITPEGFNSRLTFLQQCMRQGPTNSSNTADNLAFGRPPVCILRLGDFYHTKIIIESLTIDYEPIVWDLNPEGVGVQPMIANVNISFAFIGGSSMKGPINRLQNAISFNYFANTELYDPRAEKIVDGKIQDGSFQAAKEPVAKKPVVKKNQEEVSKIAAIVASKDASEAVTEANSEADSGEFTLEKNVKIDGDIFTITDGSMSGKGIHATICFKTDDNKDVIPPTKDYTITYILIREKDGGNEFNSDFTGICYSDLKPVFPARETEMGKINLTPEGFLTVSTDLNPDYVGDKSPLPNSCGGPTLKFFKNFSFNGKVEFMSISFQIQGVKDCNNNPDKTPVKLYDIDYGIKLKIVIEGNGEKISKILNTPVLFTS